MKKKSDKKAPNKWTKAQIVKSAMYVHDRDVVMAVLGEGKSYTVEDVDKLVRKFKEGGTK